MRTRFVGGMAAISRRSGTLERVVESIAGQLDVLYLYLNDFQEIPAFLAKYDNVVPLLAQKEKGDLNANGKMYFLQYETKGIALTLDDDIVYPPDYVRRFADTFDLFDAPVLACVHGSVFPSSPNYYYERTVFFPGKLFQKYDNIATLCGSGTAAFPIEFVLSCKHNFFGDVYVDLQLSLMAHKCKMPLVSIARPYGWLKILPYKGLWEETKISVSHHTRILKAHTHLIHWDYIRNIWLDFLSAAGGGDMKYALSRLNLSPKSMDFLAGNCFYDNLSSVLQVDKLCEFANNIYR